MFQMAGALLSISVVGLIVALFFVYVCSCFRPSLSPFLYFITVFFSFFYFCNFLIFFFFYFLFFYFFFFFLVMRVSL